MERQERERLLEAIAREDRRREAQGIVSRWQNPPQVREIMNLAQTAEYLGVAPDTLYKYANEKIVPAFKLAGRWRFRLSVLNEWMVSLEKAR